MVQVCCHLHEVVAVGGLRTGGRVLVGKVLRDAGRGRTERKPDDQRTLLLLVLLLIERHQLVPPATRFTAQQILVRFEK